MVQKAPRGGERERQGSEADKSSIFTVAFAAPRTVAKTRVEGRQVARQENQDEM